VNKNQVQFAFFAANMIMLLVYIYGDRAKWDPLAHGSILFNVDTGFKLMLVSLLFQECLKQCMNLVREGASVFFFPEGTRSRDGKMGHFKVFFLFKLSLLYIHDAAFFYSQGCFSSPYIWL
jgi:1-acyl-sn-glycerol-3-phosphate acyltransferase